MRINSFSILIRYDFFRCTIRIVGCNLNCFVIKIHFRKIFNQFCCIAAIDRNINTIQGDKEFCGYGTGIRRLLAINTFYIQQILFSCCQSSPTRIFPICGNEIYAVGFCLPFISGHLICNQKLILARLSWNSQIYCIFIIYGQRFFHIPDRHFPEDQCHITTTVIICSFKQIFLGCFQIIYILIAAKEVRFYLWNLISVIFIYFKTSISFSKIEVIISVSSFRNLIIKIGILLSRNDLFFSQFQRSSCILYVLYKWYLIKSIFFCRYSRIHINILKCNRIFSGFCIRVIPSGFRSFFYSSNFCTISVRIRLFQFQFFRCSPIGIIHFEFPVCEML